jgi:hypothetical protein
MSLPYLPRKLGKARKAERRKSKNGPQERAHESDDEDRESKLLLTTEASVLEPLRNGHNPGITVILGEPGAGKTELSIEWARMLAEKTSDPDSLAFWPVHAACGAVDTKVLLDQIPWAWLERARPPVPMSLIEHLKTAKKDQTYIRVVFILDAIDELVGPNLEDFILRLDSLPGPVVVTCRTAVWNDRVRKIFIQKKVLVLEPWEIMPLRSSEKLKFLQAWPKASKPEWASRLYRKLQASEQLSGLTRNILLLKLVTRLYVQDKEVLPTSRADFYHKAIREMWKRKSKEHSNESEQLRDHLTSFRDPLMNVIALLQASDGRLTTTIRDQTIRRASKSIKLPNGMHDLLVAELRNAGLLIRMMNQFDDVSYSFLHRTFLEYHLTQAWLQGKSKSEWGDVLRKMTLTHWMNSDFDEVLALLISTVDAAKVDVIETVKSLVDLGSIEPEEALFAFGRSPLRTALHLLKRAGVTLSSKLLGFLLKELQPKHRQMAASVDPNCPVQILEHFARSGEQYVGSRAQRSLRSLRSLRQQSYDDDESFETFTPETLASEVKLKVYDDDVDLEALHQEIRDNSNDHDRLWQKVNSDPIHPATLVVLYEVLVKEWDDTKHEVYEHMAENSDTDYDEEFNDDHPFDLLETVVHHPDTFLEILWND